MQVDKAVNKGYSVYKQGADSPQVKDASQSFSKTRDAVTKQFKDSISLVQEKGLTGTFEVAKQKAFYVVDESVLFAKRGKGLSTYNSACSLCSVAMNQEFAACRQRCIIVAVKFALYRPAYSYSASRRFHDIPHCSAGLSTAEEPGCD